MTHGWLTCEARKGWQVMTRRPVWSSSRQRMAHPVDFLWQATTPRSGMPSGVFGTSIRRTGAGSVTVHGSDAAFLVRKM